MAAANRLVKAGVGFIVLTARSYSGGRAHAFKLGYESAGQCVRERGWTGPHYSGAVRDDTNPSECSYELIAGRRRLQHGQRDCHCHGLRAGLSSDGVHSLGVTDGHVSNYFKVCDEFWQDGDPTGDLRGAGNDAIDRVHRTEQDSFYYLDITTPTWSWAIERAIADKKAPEGGAQIILDARGKNLSWSNGWVAGSDHYDHEWKAHRNPEQGFAKQPPGTYGDKSSALQLAMQSWVAVGRLRLMKVQSAGSSIMGMLKVVESEFLRIWRNFPSQRARRRLAIWSSCGRTRSRPCSMPSAWRSGLLLPVETS